MALDEATKLTGASDPVILMPDIAATVAFSASSVKVRLSSIVGSVLLISQMAEPAPPEIETGRTPALIAPTVPPTPLSSAPTTISAWLSGLLVATESCTPCGTPVKCTRNRVGVSARPILGPRVARLV